MSVIPVLERLRPEDLQCEASLGYLVKTHLKKIQNPHTSPKLTYIEWFVPCTLDGSQASILSLSYIPAPHSEASLLGPGNRSKVGTRTDVYENCTSILHATKKTSWVVGSNWV